MLARVEVALRGSDGEVVLSAAAASLSDKLHEWLAGQHESTRPCYDVAASATTLSLLAAIAEVLAGRVCSAELANAAPGLLRRAPFDLQLSVRRAASDLAFASIERLASISIVELLRGRSPAVMRVCLGAPDDLTAVEKQSALAEPLLTPPDAHDAGRASHAADEDEAAIASSLCELDARSLRALKAVSRAWRRRARAQLGDPASAWRASPEWSAGAWARAQYVPRLSDADDRVRKGALLELAALEPRVELPEFAARLAALLTPEERSSVRSLATRQLSRLEPEVLALHAGALGGALGALEPHEAAAPAAEVLVAKLRASTPRGKRLRCAGDEACPENARGRIRVAES